MTSPRAAIRRGWRASRSRICSASVVRAARIRSASSAAALRGAVALLHRRGSAGRARLATDAAGGDALAALGGRPPLGIIAFDCIARRGVLGDEGIRAEIDRLATIAAGVPVAGFYTYGEIARMRGLRGSHNQTLVVLSIG